MEKIEDVKLKLQSVAELQTEQERRRARLFLKGPIPLEWLGQAARLPGKALHVGLLLWFRVGCEKTMTVRLSQKHAQLFGLNRHAAHRALTGLESAGLVAVDRKRGRCPIVTVEKVPEFRRRDFGDG